MGTVAKLTPRPGRSGRFRRRGSLGRDWKVFHLAWGRWTFEVAARRGWGYSVWSATRGGKTVFAWGDAGCYAEVERMKKKRKVEQQGGGAAAAVMDTKLLKDLGPLVSHLAVRQYDDGDPRRPGRVMIDTVGQVWRIIIKDPDTAQELKVCQASLDDALLTACLLLEADDAPWEPDPYAKQQGPKKGKK